MKRKKPKLSSLIFAIFLVLLIIPQTRMPIQVAVNKVKLLVWAPSVLDDEHQTQLQPFTYQLSDLNENMNAIEIGNGKITFISYWATWCPPCIAELPSISTLYKDYGNQVNFILITDEEPEAVTLFLEKKGYEMPVFNPQMEAPNALYDRSIPTNYIIDANGKIVIKETGAADWNSEKVRGVLDGLLMK